MDGAVQSKTFGERILTMGKWGGLSTIGVILIIWGIFGFYRNQPAEQAIELRLGRIIDTTGPGLNWNWPYPIGSVDQVDTVSLRETIIGTQLVEGRDEKTGESRIYNRTIPEEALMLTGDENIVDLDFKVFWQVTDPEKWFYAVVDTRSTIKAVAESAMREVVGTSKFDHIITDGRELVSENVKEKMQVILDDYNAGVFIQNIQITEAQPPSDPLNDLYDVKSAYEDVQTAEQEKDRAQNTAQSYQNQEFAKLKGSQARILNDATAYKNKTINEAQGKAEAFNKFHSAYEAYPEQTWQTMFFETMEIYYGSNKRTVVDSGSSILPHMALPSASVGPVIGSGKSQ